MSTILSDDEFGVGGFEYLRMLKMLNGFTFRNAFIYIFKCLLVIGWCNDDMIKKFDFSHSGDYHSII